MEPTPRLKLRNQFRFRCLDDVERHVNEFGGGDPEYLRVQLMANTLHGPNFNWANAWLHQVDAKMRADAEASATQLERRSVEAQEDAARHARDAARWARGAMLIALAALVVSAWPLIKDVGRIGSLAVAGQ